MVIQLHLKYKTHYGQTLYLCIHEFSGSNNMAVREIKMDYLDEEYWHVVIDSEEQGIKEGLDYHYLLRENGQADQYDLSKKRTLNFKKLKAGYVNVYDEWQEVLVYESVFISKPFEEILNRHKVKPAKKDKAKKFTHVFRVFIPHLEDDKVVCLLGSSKEFHNWSETEPVILTPVKNYWTVSLNLGKVSYPVAYKFGVYSLGEKKLVYFEDGNNRILPVHPGKDRIQVHNAFCRFDRFKWKGAGLNVPVSALKSTHSWGVGDFTDLHLLIDWAKQAGIKLVQLLPVNDTTATHSVKDSYPYASISAFALHPLYLNVEKLCAAAGVDVTGEMRERILALNELNRLDYVAVAKIKQEAVRAVYHKEKHIFRDDLDFFEFFDLNRDWLVPYAAFCYLRDNNNTSDASKWDDHNLYDEDAVQELVSPDNAHYDEIAIHYFIQYHLHLQLLDAVTYAHKHGIILKGDLPIGVGRYGVETWMYPGLFHMDMQAGAPPDAFAVKGQNWEFPTYNWEEMGKDNYAWWRHRMEHMSNYFDAIRIDHILGFFRIWSIPRKDIEGILGTFVPALPLGIPDFENAGIHFNEDRLCSPYITDNLLSRDFPGNEEWVKTNLLEHYRFKTSVDSQQKLEAFFKKNPEKAFLKNKLFDLLTDVILLKDAGKANHYHFRINMQHTDSYDQLDDGTKQMLIPLYQRYFFEMQDELWQDTVQRKLNALQMNTSMLLCAEDLGMVPDFVESVLSDREILSLQVQRMPKKINEQFSHPANALYLSVVTPSTHDMSTLREWWEEERSSIQYFYNHLLGQHGNAPYYCEPWICREIIAQHLDSPAMWAVFLLQDLLAIDGNLRRENPVEERINVPADPNHNWDYRMHITLEKLLDQSPLINELHLLIHRSGR